MTKLTYIPKTGFACPGEGWPAASHDEPDAGLAVRKVASGFYRRSNAGERRQEDATLAAAKKAANAKFEKAAQSEIAASDQAVRDAQETADRTRRRLGKEE